MSECTCNHDGYWSEFDGGRRVYCFGCAATWRVGDDVSRKIKPDYLPGPAPMPEKTRDLTRADLPWDRIPLALAQQYGWYIATLWQRETLVMPIYRNGGPVFYSGRVLGEAQTKHKYVYPPRYAKVPWLSTDTLWESNTVFIAEGVADAAYLSQWGASIGLLGMSYDGSLNHLLEGKQIIVAMDGDYAGVIGGIRVGAKLPGNPRIFTLVGKDPTDYSDQDVIALLTS